MDNEHNVFQRAKLVLLIFSVDCVLGVATNELEVVLENTGLADLHGCETVAFPISNIY